VSDDPLSVIAYPLINSAPPMYFLSAVGTTTLPSACW